MALRYASPLVFPAVKAHTATVIFAHGLGDTGHGWASAVENWRRRSRLDEVKFILPHAPQIPITCNGGFRMPGWFDIAVLDGEIESMCANEDAAGITASREYLHGLIQKEIDAGIPADRIVLGGFSQGGAMSIFAGLTAKVKLAGIVALSSWLLLSMQFRELLPKPEFNRDTPILMLHGDSDPLVRTELGKLSYSTLNAMGYDISWKEYPGMGHSACLEELDDVETFLGKRLPPKDGAAAEETGKSEL
ncbi:putative acyl-protein thioesterase 1 protein [Phaeoacremonium minimum UCRPA7]|uniref:Acyl-protein thioesterase 1 n=1 Tax=Phaeoacremonium minimum (strain UCR-PA7) TaxID=1286976 RepID=R8BIJ0_PHAM7|nr:putative acyl-protein thioesterase 1 protein [Phaeoacremonium minimum UCRPA7]EON99057.1 putative acyl-protein thioesterase 1 protein [Phaeoacremonium minimum UCRPA7]